MSYFITHCVMQYQLTNSQRPFLSSLFADNRKQVPTTPNRSLYGAVECIQRLFHVKIVHRPIGILRSVLFYEEDGNDQLSVVYRASFFKYDNQYANETSKQLCTCLQEQSSPDALTHIHRWEHSAQTVHENNDVKIVYRKKRRIAPDSRTVFLIDM